MQERWHPNLYSLMESMFSWTDSAPETSWGGLRLWGRPFARCWLVNIGVHRTPAAEAALDIGRKSRALGVGADGQTVCGGHLFGWPGEMAHCVCMHAVLKAH